MVANSSVQIQGGLALTNHLVVVPGVKKLYKARLLSASVLPILGSVAIVHNLTVWCSCSGVFVYLHRFLVMVIPVKTVLFTLP